MLEWEKERAGAKGNAPEHCSVVEHQNSCATSADATPELFGTRTPAPFREAGGETTYVKKHFWPKSKPQTKPGFRNSNPRHELRNGVSLATMFSKHTYVLHRKDLLLAGASVQHHPAHQTPSLSMSESWFCPALIPSPCRSCHTPRREMLPLLISSFFTLCALKFPPDFRQTF